MYALTRDYKNCAHYIISEHKTNTIKKVTLILRKEFTIKQKIFPFRHMYNYFYDCMFKIRIKILKTYQPWNKKSGYFLKLLNPSVGIWLIFVFRVTIQSLQLLFKKAKTKFTFFCVCTYFLFLSEVQHISTCSNNVCPCSFIEEKHVLYLFIFHLLQPFPYQSNHWICNTVLGGRSCT